MDHDDEHGEHGDEHAEHGEGHDEHEEHGEGHGEHGKEHEAHEHEEHEHGGHGHEGHGNGHDKHGGGHGHAAHGNHGHGHAKGHSSAHGHGSAHKGHAATHGHVEHGKGQKAHAAGHTENGHAAHAHAEHAPAQAPKPEEKPRSFVKPLVTFFLVFTLNVVFGADTFWNFWLFWGIVIYNFGFTLMSAVVFAVFFPVYYFHFFGWATGRAFMLFNGALAVYLILKILWGIVKSLGSGIGEKMEAAEPTPPDGEIFGEALENIGYKTGEAMRDNFRYSGAHMGKKVGKSSEELSKKFRELMKH